jgi:hypothetical protein
MLSSVLRSARAVQVNVEIMRAFVRLRHVAAAVSDLARKLDELEQAYDARFRTVFQAIRQLMQPPTPPRRRIGFVTAESRAQAGGSVRARRQFGAVRLTDQRLTPRA